MNQWQNRLQGGVGSINQGQSTQATLTARPLIDSVLAAKLASQHLRRAAQAAAIIQQGWVVENDRPGIYLVSSNGQVWYEVDANERHCQCADHLHRLVVCKHLQAADVVQAALLLRAASVVPQEGAEQWAA